jgi:phosphohistidine phosphatase
MPTPPPRTLYLLRHAKSSWADEGVADVDRPLAPRGERDARRLAQRLGRQGVDPDVVLCSPALRARQTLELLRPGLREDVEVLVEDGLYGAVAAALLQRLRRLPDTCGSALLVGHNPGLQELALRLAGAAERDRLSHFPTAALAVLAVRSAGWGGLDDSGAALVSYTVPRERRHDRAG